MSLLKTIMLSLSPLNWFYRIWLILFFYSSNYYQGYFLFSSSLEYFTPLFWLVTTLVLNSFNYKNYSRVESAFLLFYSYYTSLLLDRKNAYNILVDNSVIFFNFFKYLYSGITHFFFKYQIWYPIFKKNGYLFLLNSSRTRWQLSKNSSIFENK